MRLLLCVLAALLALPTVASARGGVDVQLLSLNDFHGHLETTTPSSQPHGKQAPSRRS